MNVVFLHAETQNAIMSIEGLDIVPSVMDLVVLPDGKLFRVMQRAFVMEKVRDTATKIVDLRATTHSLSIVVQLVVAPVEVNSNGEEVVQ